jgi:hypothetical protein
VSRKKQLDSLRQSPAVFIEPNSRSAHSNNDVSTFTVPLPQKLDSEIFKSPSLNSEELALLQSFFELLSVWEESLNGGNHHE